MARQRGRSRAAPAEPEHRSPPGGRGGGEGDLAAAAPISRSAYLIVGQYIISRGEDIQTYTVYRVLMVFRIHRDAFCYKVARFDGIRDGKPIKQNEDSV